MPRYLIGREIGNIRFRAETEISILTRGSICILP